MEEVSGYFSKHPAALFVAVIVCFFLLFLFYRKIVSAIAVLLVVFLLTLLGYSYYRDTTSLEEALKKTKVESQEILERLADFFHKAENEVVKSGKDAGKRLGG